MKKPFVIGVFISLVMVSHLANAENKDKDFRCWDINKRGDLPASQLYGNVVAGCDTQKPYSISPLISSGNVIRTTICCWGK